MATLRNSKLYLLIVNGFISAFGPFVTDFYLPALPALNQYFNTTASLVQLSLTFGLVGLAVGQLIVGPLSDKYGRKRPLVLSLVVFCVSTLGCLFSPNIYLFIVFRLLQGVAGAGGVVISRSIAADIYEGNELTKFFSMLSAVQGIAPICAPVLGGLMLGITDWKGIFWILLVIGVALWVALIFFKESLDVDKRHKGNVLATFSNFIPVLRHRRFMRFVLVQALAMGVMFTYIAASPFIFQEYFGTSPVVYSLCFGINALGIMGGSFAVALFRDTLAALKVGAAGFCAMSVVVAAILMVSPSLMAVEVSLFLMLVFLGLIMPSSTSLALNLQRDNSGSASAMLGFLSFLAGGILSPLTGMGNMLYTTGIIMVACSISSLVCTFAGFRRR